MQQHGDPICRDNAYTLLHDCEKSKDLQKGRRVQSLMVYSGLHFIAVLGDHLIRLFGHHECLPEANKVLDSITKPGNHTWAAIILANAKRGLEQHAIELYQNAELSDLKGDTYVCVAVLKACIRTKAHLQARLIHEQVLERSSQLDEIVGSTLMNVHAKCGNLKEALFVFQALPNRNVVSWNIMIAGYAQHGQGLVALEYFEKMQQEGVKPDGITFSSLLQASSNIYAVGQGRLIHEQIITAGIRTDVIVQSTLVDMYAKSQRLEEAQKIFNKLRDKTVVTWNTMISAYAQHEDDLRALECIENMRHEGLMPNVVSWNAIVAGYIRHGKVHLAAECFERMQCEGIMPNVVTWNTIIVGFSQHGDGLLALECFEKIVQGGLQPDEFSFSSALKACAKTKSISRGRLIHAKIDESPLFSPEVGDKLVDMYAECGSLEEASKAFSRLPIRYITTWNAMIAADTQNMKDLSFLEYFEEMQREKVEPDCVTFSLVVEACASKGTIEQGRLIHESIMERNLEIDAVLGSTLVDMYVSCGGLEEACREFDLLPNKDVVLWSTMVAGYARHGEGYLALECYEEMRKEGIKPTDVMFLTTLKACIIVAAIEQGRCVHEQLMESEFLSDIVVGNALVDMYAKCGSLEEACKAFNRLPSRDVVSWNTLIGGYAHYGEGSWALKWFYMMQSEDINPDEISFSSVLVACSRGGLVEEGRWYCKAMKEHYGITQNISHSSCMVDLLARAGSLDEAESLLQSLFPTDMVGWTSLLSACKMHGNVNNSYT